MTNLQAISGCPLKASNTLAGLCLAAVFCAIGLVCFSAQCNPAPATSAPSGEPNGIIIPKFISTEEVDYLESDGRGQASVREQAVLKALEEAISKKGATFSAEIKLKLESKIAIFNATKTTRVQQSVASDFTRATGGLLQWWDIKSEKVESDVWTVEVVAVVAKIKTPSASHPTRKTLAVLPFRVSQEVRIFNRFVPAVTFGSQLREAALTYLVQSRKFAIADGTFDEELDGLAASKPAQDPIKRAIDAAQKVGAQYLVIGLADGVVVSHKTIGGLSVSIVNGAVSLRVIETHTRQTVLAKAFALRDLPEMDLGAEHPEISMVDVVGRAIAERTLETIYPLKVAALNGEDEVILNRGGEGISAGDRFELFNPGEEIKDPTTGESLGVVERKIGLVEVVRVLPKVSYARIVEKSEPVQAEALCRKPQIFKSDVKTQDSPKKVQNEINELFK